VQEGVDRLTYLLEEVFGILNSWAVATESLVVEVTDTVCLVKEGTGVDSRIYIFRSELLGELLGVHLKYLGSARYFCHC
jgi:hypothetical protein